MFKRKAGEYRIRLNFIRSSLYIWCDMISFKNCKSFIISIHKNVQFNIYKVEYISDNSLYCEI